MTNMLIKKDVVFDLLKDFFGRILIIAGLFSVFVGLLYASQLGSLTNASALFLGALLIDMGFVIHFELFRVKLRSKEGLGNILICIAPLLIASGVIAVLFAEPDWSRAYILPPTRMGTPVGWKGWVTVIAPLVRVYLWLAQPLIISGVILLAIGFLLRIYDSIS